MNAANIRWGHADVITGGNEKSHGNQAPEGGPMHLHLLEKRKKKLERRARRYALQVKSA